MSNTTMKKAGKSKSICLAFGICFVAFVSLLRCASSKASYPTFAEGPETSLVSSEESVQSDETQASSKEGEAVPAEPVIPDDKWADFEAKAKEIIAKAIAIAGSVGAFVLVVLKFITWLTDRGLIKQNNANAKLLADGCQAVNQATERFKEQMGSVIDDAKAEIEESKKQLEQSKKEIQELKEVLAIVLKSDPNLIAAGAYKKAMPYLGVNEDGAGE